MKFSGKTKNQDFILWKIHSVGVKRIFNIFQLVRTQYIVFCLLLKYSTNIKNEKIYFCKKFAFFYFTLTCLVKQHS